jgi:Inositol 1,3,4-trisphosphate 5/6-kinase pre-ATP-grasp domain
MTSARLEAEAHRKIKNVAGCCPRFCFDPIVTMITSFDGKEVEAATKAYLDLFFAKFDPIANAKTFESLSCNFMYELDEKGKADILLHMLQGEQRAYFEQCLEICRSKHPITHVICTIDARMASQQQVSWIIRDANHLQKVIGHGVSSSDRWAHQDVQNALGTIYRYLVDNKVFVQFEEAPIDWSHI